MRSQKKMGFGLGRHPKDTSTTGCSELWVQGFLKNEQRKKPTTLSPIIGGSHQRMPCADVY